MDLTVGQRRAFYGLERPDVRHPDDTPRREGSARHSNSPEARTRHSALIKSCMKTTYAFLTTNSNTLGITHRNDFCSLRSYRSWVRIPSGVPFSILPPILGGFFLGFELTDSSASWPLPRGSPRGRAGGVRSRADGGESRRPKGVSNRAGRTIKKIDDLAAPVGGYIFS